MKEVNVPFLIITLKLNDIILSFNTLQYLVQNRNDIESIVSLFQTEFDEVDRDKMQNVCWTNSSKQSETKVKVKGEDVIIPVVLIEKQIAMIFQQRDLEIPVEIHCANNVVPADTQRLGDVP